MMSGGGGLPRRLAREPLVHFLVAGAVLFAAFQVLGTPEAETDENVIVVDRAALLSYMQYRVNAFEPELFGAALDSMSEAERAALVEEYASEEALYREAQALGLAESDYIIRQRMIQKLEFLLGDMGQEGVSDEAALAGYFETNREAYAVEPAVTFTHVFFDVDRRGEAGAEAAAREAASALEAEGAGFNDAPGRGDRFPFLTNYVERTLEYVASHFGEDFARAMGAQTTTEGEWVGPVRSAFGWHAVLITRRTERRLPALEEVREDVERDFARERSEEALAEMTRSLRQGYRVVVDLDAPEPAP